MSTIRETALECYGGRLPRGTGAKAQEVLDCLVAREQAMFGDLVEQAVGFGVSRDQAHLALVNAGMHAPDPTPAPEAGTPEHAASLEERLSSLEHMVASGLDYARSKGFRG